jgi:hypothetical protein
MTNAGDTDGKSGTRLLSLLSLSSTSPRVPAASRRSIAQSPVLRLLIRLVRQQLSIPWTSELRPESTVELRLHIVGVDEVVGEAVPTDDAMGLQVSEHGFADAPKFLFQLSSCAADDEVLSAIDHGGIVVLEFVLDDHVVRKLRNGIVVVGWT